MIRHPFLAHAAYGPTLDGLITGMAMGGCSDAEIGYRLGLTVDDVARRRRALGVASGKAHRERRADKVRASGGVR